MRSTYVAIVFTLSFVSGQVDHVIFTEVVLTPSDGEYVEISKEYSSPNSSTFINGVLNNIYRKLDKEGMINKNERGSQ